MNVIGIILIASMVFTGVNVSGFDTATVQDELMPLAAKLSVVTGYAPVEVLHEVFGNVEISYAKRNSTSYECWYTLKCYGEKIIPFDGINDGLLVHEFGHRFLRDLNLPFSETYLSLGYYENGKYIHVAGINPVTGKYERTSLGYPEAGRPYEQHAAASDNYNSFTEDFADMFAGWALNRFSDDTAGRLRNEWMDNFISQHTPRAEKYRPVPGTNTIFGLE